MLGGLFGGGDGGEGEMRKAIQDAINAAAAQKKYAEDTVKPWYEQGTSAIGRLGTLLGLAGDSAAEGYGSLAKPFGLDDFEADPGYQFRLAEGEKALQRALAAKGKFFSPEAVNALGGFSQNMASEEFNRAYGRDDNNRTRLYNMLTGVSGAGQAAGNTMVDAGQQYTNALMSLLMSRGEVAAAGNQRKDALKSQMLSSLGGNILSFASSPSQSLFGYNLWGGGGGSGGGGMGNLANLAAVAQAIPSISDRRLKKNIQPDGHENGHKMYTFEYDHPNAPEGVYRGVMAQDVMEYNPTAVTDNGGFYEVDYSKLGVTLERVG